MNYDILKKNFEKHGFHTAYFETGEEAASPGAPTPRIANAATMTITVNMRMRQPPPVAMRRILACRPLRVVGMPVLFAKERFRFVVGRFRLAMSMPSSYFYGSHRDAYRCVSHRMNPTARPMRWMSLTSSSV